MLSLIRFSYAVFHGYPWEVCSFLKGSGGAVDLVCVGGEMWWGEWEEGKLWSGCIKSQTETVYRSVLLNSKETLIL